MRPQTLRDVGILSRCLLVWLGLLEADHSIWACLRTHASWRLSLHSMTCALRVDDVGHSLLIIQSLLSTPLSHILWKLAKAPQSWFGCKLAIHSTTVQSL